MRDINKQVIEVIQLGYIDELKYLVEVVGADIHVDDDYPLRTATYRGHLNIVKYLIEKGATINIMDGITLRLATYAGNFKMVKYLVENGANISCDSGSSLRWACKKGRIDVVLYLRNVAGDKWKCHDCLIKPICLELCEGWYLDQQIKAKKI